ncbi:TPA: hypothetical protein N0F65_004447 [Lagenidium giganteum]|uniref:PHD-type domain-containing protein n=1 Tax=Lagenidium giganteum TaxID=4803 RepID=A0AAV2ZGC4_9STRA|nr:TPA: hypothetical protein N0F65_004447 [Lagenidium giganteum]
MPGRAAHVNQLMNRRTATAADGSPYKDRAATSSARADGSPASSTASSSSTGVQFLPLRSRVGKRFQAVIPDLRADVRAAPRDAAKPRYCPERARELGAELEKYLKLALSLREGATFDSKEQVTTAALAFLHRYDYNTADAACMLYAQHSIELPRSTAVPTDGSMKPTPADEEARWLSDFYRVARQTTIDHEQLDRLTALHGKGQELGLEAPELEVLGRIVTRATNWIGECAQVATTKVDKATILRLIYAAEDMQLALEETQALKERLARFEAALVKLKEALDRANRRNQTKVHLVELEKLFAATIAERVSFQEEEEIARVVEEARELQKRIASLLGEEKVSLQAMRDVIAKIEVVPINFEAEVEQFQQKMLSAQNWLAKVRKCIPKRRPTRRGGPDPRKMDLEAIRALVEDAPCDDSVEMFEMQDLLECADEWATKVRSAIENGADITLDELKELMDEGNDMPVDMDEQIFLAAEIAAREWTGKALAMLAARKSLKELEEMVENAKEIRKQIHPKKQGRWKPQAERDIHAAIDTARKWVNEVRDTLGVAVFEKLFPKSLLGDVSGKDSHHNNEKQKKTMDVVTRLLEKSERLSIDMTSYVNPLKQLLEQGLELQQQAAKTLSSVGWIKPAPPSNSETSSSLDVLMSVINHENCRKEISEKGDFAAASALLDAIDSLPLLFEEGSFLDQVVQSEKEWAQRVRDALPPRQSRKKRMAKNRITVEELQKLLEEYKFLHFHFPDELKLLVKELEEIETWREKARSVVENRATTDVLSTIRELKELDLSVYSKLNRTDTKTNGTSELSARSGTTGDTKMEDQKSEFSAPVAEPMDVDSDNKATVAPLEASNVSDGVQSGDTADADSKEKVPDRPVKIESDLIIERVRKESGCVRKEPQVTEDNGSKGRGKKSKGVSLLEPLLGLVEESILSVNTLEAREEKPRTVDEILPPGEKINANPDEAVKLLDGWSEQITRILDESSLLNAVAPEQRSLETIFHLLEWLHNSRSIFYYEPLPLKELVAKGRKLEDELMEMRFLSAMSDETMDVLEFMLWPLSHLVAQDKVVSAWVDRVKKCLEEKHAPVDSIHALLTEGNGLLMDPDAVASIYDEIKKAKSWLSKLRKRLKSLITKNVSRLSMSVARSLVEEGDELVVELSAYDFLKENVDTAADWEKRVLESGIENGQARIAYLVGLMDEYDRAHLIIDLDMHREVLKSATERYCICRQPFDGLMIGCDHCDDWFHDTCIGISKEKAEKVENYTCPSCNILQDLEAILVRMTNDGEHSALWEAADYAKTYDKQHNMALRKVKREEKAIERSEMLLFSCNNHINQLRSRIDDIERAKACISIKHSLPNGDATGAPSINASKPPQTTLQPLPATHPTISPGLVLAAAASAAAVMPSTPAAAATLASMDFAHQYPNILLPPSSHKSSATSTPTTATPPANPATTSKAPAAPTAQAAPAAPATAAAAPTPIVVSATPPVAPKAPEEAATSAPAPVGTAKAPEPAIKTQPTIAPAPAVASEKKSDAKVIAEVFPQLLTPGAGAVPVEHNERLSALVVAGGVEQQLSQMKVEHQEVLKQVEDLQESLRLSRERLKVAQEALREMQQAHESRQRLLPAAQKWVRHAVETLNTVTLLSRPPCEAMATDKPTPHLPTEYSQLIDQARDEEVDQFPEVRNYTRLLRGVAWALYVVTLLQERPSRECMMEAINYAVKHNLWENKTITPLRAVIGRIDVWIGKAQKCISKGSGTKTQKISRLKSLMNEYSKLPLSCSWVQTLEEYIRAVDMEVGDEMSMELLQKTQASAEAAAVAAVTAAAAGGASAMLSSSPGPAKAPRKRKPRKAPAPATPAKKTKGSSPGDCTTEAAPMELTS